MIRPYDHRPFSGRTIAVISVLIFMRYLLPVQGADNEACIFCHEDQEEMGDRYVDEAAYQKSIHGEHLCISCHKDVDPEDFPHEEGLAPVACSDCHRLETQIYLDSDHGQAVAHGKWEAATCKDCHGHSHTLINSRDPESPVHRRNIANTCARCHQDPKVMANATLTEKDPFQSYAHTAHGQGIAQGHINAAVCSDCHGTHDLHGSANPKSRIYKKRIPETCGRCHQNVAAVYNESVHGKAEAAGIKEAPVCTDCHGEHTIRSPGDTGSSVWTGSITKTCAHCHASEKLVLKSGLPLDRLESYLKTYHGLASKRGDLHVANCASCHGFHDVLPSDDPRSSVHKDNLSKTCGRCHAGVSDKLAVGFVHGPPSSKHWILHFVEHFYIIMIIVVIGSMLVHNGLDLLRKALGFVPDHGAHEDQLRLTVNERWQHAFLMITFVLLAYSGFALKFPDTAWARVLAHMEEGTRQALHRWTALVFCLLGAYHMAYLGLTRQGRRRVVDMLPRIGDVKAALGCTAFYLGIREKPSKAQGFYNYAEKMEYWALIWGSIIMASTGGILVFNDLALQYFPLWISDLATMIHYYEAVLACLAIVVWHLYGVIYDPMVYPMHWAWLSGYMKIRKKKKDDQ